MSIFPWAVQVGSILVCGGLGIIVLAVFTLFKEVAQYASRNGDFRRNFDRTSR